jgi:hypothetical protein
MSELGGEFPFEPSSSELPDSTEQDLPSPARIPLIKRIGNVCTAAVIDFKESPHKIRMAGIATGVAALQVADRMRASVIFVPTIATNVLEHSHSPTAAAIAGGTAFGGWCAAVGGATTEGLANFPAATSEFEKSFSGVVNFFEDSLPGFEQPEPRDEETSRARHVGGRALTRLKRAYTVSGIGSVAYVSAASATDRPKKEIHELNLNASADGAAAIGAVVLGVAEVIVKIGESNPALAEHIQNTASDIRVWYGVAGLMMAQQFISKKFKQRREAKNQKNQVEVVEPAISEE